MQIHDAGDAQHETASMRTSEFSFDTRMLQEWMSVRTVLGLLCVVTAGAMFGLGFLSVSTCDDALDTANEAGDDAFNACMASAEKLGNSNARETMGLLSLIVLDQISTTLTLFSSEVNRYRRRAAILPTPLNASDYNWLKKTSDEMLITTDSMGGIGLTDMAIITNDKAFVITSVSGEVPEITFNDGSDTPGNNATHSVQFEIDPYIFRPIPDSEKEIWYSMRNGTFSVDLQNGLVAPDEITWGAVTVHDSFTGIAQRHMFFDAYGNDVILLMGYSTARLGVFLSSLMEGLTSRLYVVVGSSWLADSYANLGKPSVAQERNDTGLLIAYSHGNMTGQKDVESDDSLTAQIATAIYALGGYQVIIDRYNGTASGNISGAGYFFHVEQYTLFSGIDWYIVGGVPVAEILEESLKASEAIFARRSVAKKEASDKVDSSLLTIFLVSSGVAAALGAASVAVSMLITHPVRQLQKDMKRVSNMELEGSKQQGLSLLYEISEIQKSFMKMVSNLEEFRAFVPTALLGSSGSVLCILPPEGDIALVFTDIVSSTSLWAKAPHEMDIALEKHNQVMRSWAEKENGYEVKTIGDAFMVAFSTPQSAVRFCCGVQGDLLEEEWPEELDLPPVACKAAKTKEQLLWSGLRVRMGCHYGSAILEENPLTGRSDYRGTTVNKASRVEGKALAGTVCVTDELVAEIRSMESGGQVVVKDHKVHDLKGLGNIHLNLLINPRLSERLDASASKAYEILSSPADGLLHGDHRSSGASSRSSMDVPGLPSAAGVRGKKRGGPKKCQLSLSKEVATVAVVKLNRVRDDKVFDNCNLMIRSVGEVAAQTDGTMGGLSGDAVVVSWNTSKAVKQHVAAGMRFASEVQRRAGCVLRVGLATGSVLHGNVGTKSSRYHNIFGSPVKAAEACVALARDFHSFALIADCTDDGALGGNPTVSSFIRIVDAWHDRCTGGVFHLYQMHTEKFQSEFDNSWGVTTEDKAEVEYKKTFYSALGGDAAALERIKDLAAEGDGDETLAVVHKLLSAPRDGVNELYRVKVGLTGAPSGVVDALGDCDYVLGSPM